jgi:hypothetical protein
MYWAIRSHLSERKATLFAVACARCTSLPAVPVILEQAIAVVEPAAEGGDCDELATLNQKAGKACSRAVQKHGFDSAPHCLALAALRLTDRPLAPIACHVPLFLGMAVRQLMGPEQADHLAQLHADLLRDVIGNPFRPLSGKPAKRARRSRARPAPAPPWRTAAVLGLAQSIYEERAFDHMPILADALEDAGCDNAELVEHCRSGVPHVRGCWVIDLLTDRS